MDDLERAGGRVRDEPYVEPTSLDVLIRRASRLRRRRGVAIGSPIGIILIAAIAITALALSGRENSTTVDVVGPPREGTSTPRRETPPCQPNQLVARFASFARTGTESSGVVFLTNTSTVTCSLTGYPNVTMTNTTGQPLDVRAKHFNGRAPNNLEPNPVTMKPHSASQAAVELDWINWCHGDPGQIRLSLALTGWPRPITVRSNVKTQLPACGPAGQPSTLFIAPVAVADDSGIPTLPPLPSTGVAVQTATGVAFVDLSGRVLTHLDGYTLTSNWRPDQPVAVQDQQGRRFALDTATNALVPASPPSPEQPSDWPKLARPPPPSPNVVVRGHWRWSLPSFDGKTLLAQWSGECEVPQAFFISTGQKPRSVWSSNWADAPDTFGLGWAPNGHAVIFLMGEPGCGGPAANQGVYLVDVKGSKRLVYRGSSAQLWRP